MKQIWTDCLASVDRYNRTSAVLMTPAMMATFDAQNAETDLPSSPTRLSQ